MVRPRVQSSACSTGKGVSISASNKGLIELEKGKTEVDIADPHKLGFITLTC
jgi:hypothetical protein